MKIPNSLICLVKVATGDGVIVSSVYYQFSRLQVLLPATRISSEVSRCRQLCRWFFTVKKSTVKLQSPDRTTIFAGTEITVAVGFSANVASFDPVPQVATRGSTRPSLRLELNRLRTDTACQRTDSTQYLFICPTQSLVPGSVNRTKLAG